MEFRLDQQTRRTILRGRQSGKSTISMILMEENNKKDKKKPKRKEER